MSKDESIKFTTVPYLDKDGNDLRPEIGIYKSHLYFKSGVMLLALPITIDSIVDLTLFDIYKKMLPSIDECVEILSK